MARVGRVLIVYENDSTLFAAIQVAEGLRASMHASMPPGIEIYSEYLDTVRFASPGNLTRLAEYLSSKYDGMKFDAVMAVGPGALKFLLDHRDTVGEGAPIAFGAVNESSLRNRTLPADVKGVISTFDVRKTIDLALTLQPNAKQIVVMTGSSAFDKGWQESARTILADRYAGVPVKYQAELSLEGFKAVAKGLTSTTILLILTIFEDADGRKYTPRDAAQAIAEVSGAPVYTVYSSYLGAGALGGYVGSFNAIGEEMGAVAARMVKGDFSDPQTSMVKDGPLVDWRQIPRWGIDPKLIPEHAEIQNYEMSAWQKYRVEIVTMATVILLQAATIIGLLLQRRRKIRLQAELNLEQLELAYLSRTSQLGELSGALAHKLNQPLTSILANAQTGAGLLENQAFDVEEMRDILNDIVLDNKRATAVITQLRHLMIRGETVSNGWISIMQQQRHWRLRGANSCLDRPKWISSSTCRTSASREI